MSVPKPEVRVKKEEILATRKIRVDLSDTKPKQPVHPIAKKQHKPQWFAIFVVEQGILALTASSCMQASKQLNKKCMCQKHKIH